MKQFIKNGIVKTFAAGLVFNLMQFFFIYSVVKSNLSHLNFGRNCILLYSPVIFFIVFSVMLIRLVYRRRKSKKKAALFLVVLMLFTIYWQVAAIAADQCPICYGIKPIVFWTKIFK